MRRFFHVCIAATLVLVGTSTAFPEIGVPGFETTLKLYDSLFGAPEAVHEPGPEKAGVTSSRWDDRDRNRIYDELDEKLQLATSGETFPIIVLFNEPPTEAYVAALKQDLGGFFVKSNNERPGVEGKAWEIIPGFSADLTKTQILDLARRAEVMHVELDGEVRAFLSTATVEAGVDKANTDFGVTGDFTGNNKVFSTGDMVICVIDTGIHNAHVDLNEGQVIGWRDEVNGQTSPYDDNGHGTHVASIAAGQGDGNVANRGVAYGAALVGVKVLNSAGSGTETDIVDGINWCNNNRATYAIDIITMSLGGGTCTSGNDAMSSAANSAWNNGLIVLVAAGNSGPGYCTVASPGSAANVITVGANSDPKSAACTVFGISYKAGGWYLGDYSSRGTTGDGRVKPDIVAPGTCITAAQSGTTTGYITYSGTSMATPFVAGVAALMKDANYALTNNDVKSRLMSTSQDWGPDNQVAEPQSYDYGAGRLQAYEAVKNACGCSGTGPSNPTHFYREEDLAGAGKRDEYSLQVTTTSWRIALTLIIPSASATKDYDLRLYNPSGTQVASSLGTARQETISYLPTVTGTYKVRVESYTGSGVYWLDASAGASTMTLSLDQ